MTEAIILDMDKERELKWTFGAIKIFEKRAKELLKRLDIRNDKGQQIASQPMHAGYILANFLRISDIMEAAVGAATGLSALDGKDKSSEASDAIDAYIERGHSLEDLQRCVYKAYLVAADPSSIQEWEANIAREEEIKRINKEKQEARMEVARLELADDLKKIERLKGISGAAPTSSAI
jgi:hypothetical protein